MRKFTLPYRVRSDIDEPISLVEFGEQAAQEEEKEFNSENIPKWTHLSASVANLVLENDKLYYSTNIYFDSDGRQRYSKNPILIEIKENE